MPEVGWLSILPPLFAIVLAIWTRQVYLSLFAGIWAGYTVLAGGNLFIGFGGALDGLLRVFEDTSNTRVIMFSLLVGVLIAYTQGSGGVDGFINWLVKKDLVKSRRSAGLLAWLIGIVIFVESSITCLVTGAVCRPIFDKHRISREKLAYIIDSTSAPVCVMIPLNAWGAFVVSLLADQDVQSPVSVFAYSVPFNFYAILTVFFVFGVVFFGYDFGLMKQAETRARETGKLLRDGATPLVSGDLVEMKAVEGIRPRAVNMVIPVLVMVLMMPVGLYVTGGGDILSGDGSTSVLWAVLMGVITGAVLYIAQGLMSLAKLSELFVQGAKALMPMAILMMLAFAIGAMTRELGTGNYVARVTHAWLNPAALPAIIFVTAAVIAFSTGTSWGTFAIMVPIVVPLVTNAGGYLPLSLAAVLGGGVFGDHCSPISDTTIISSMASASDHIDHVKTQLPYALVTAGAAFLLFLIAGILL